MSYSKLTYDAFLRITRQNKTLEYVFLLGAGASTSSGVPSAKDCIGEWKKEIFLTNNLHESPCDDLKSESVFISTEMYELIMSFSISFFSSSDNSSATSGNPPKRMYSS